MGTSAHALNLSVPPLPAPGSLVVHPHCCEHPARRGCKVLVQSLALADLVVVSGIFVLAAKEVGSSSYCALCSLFLTRSRHAIGWSIRAKSLRIHIRSFTELLQDEATLQEGRKAESSGAFFSSSSCISFTFSPFHKVISLSMWKPGHRWQAHSCGVTTWPGFLAGPGPSEAD